MQPENTLIVAIVAFFGLMFVGMFLLDIHETNHYYRCVENLKSASVTASDLITICERR